MNISVLTLACLCAGLLFDPAGFLRLTLLASCIHEFGHIFFYILCKAKLPKITVTPAGISLNSTQDLSLTQDFIVTCAGPLFNFATVLILWLTININATYILYFFMAINLCVGVYNLLPVGMLDGARLIYLAEIKCKAKSIYIFKKCVIWVFFVCLVFCAIYMKSAIYIKACLIGTAVYLLIKSQ